MGLADSADRDRDRSRGGADLNADSLDAYVGHPAIIADCVSLKP